MADVEIDPFNSDEVSWGTGATLYSTKNLTALGTGTPVTVAFNAYGIEETAVFKVVSAPVQNGSPELYSIMGDLTGFAHLRADVRPDDAHFMNNGTASDLAAAWGSGNVAAYSTDNKRVPIWYTTDSGSTWNAFANIPEQTASGSIAVGADGQTVVWVPGAISAKTYFTKDFGGLWYISNGLSMGAKITADKLEANVFYAVCSGKGCVSTDGATNFTETGLTLADNCELVPSAEKKGFLWVRSGTSVGYSEDYGKTVTYLKDVSANAIGVGKAQKEGGAMTLYLMGETKTGGSGIYMTTDHGKHMEKLTTEKDGFGNLTPSITGDATAWGRFYFATNGRGIIMGDVRTEG
jgi:hypothetical protein